MNSTPLLLDASIILKWFIDEIDSSLAKELGLRFRKRRVILTTTRFTFYEVANALKYTKRFSSEDIRGYLKDLTDSGLHIFEYQLNVLQEAVEISMESNISVYDAYYIAQADIEGFRFVTADAKLVDKLRGVTDIMTLEESVMT
jgi:predicted nucleic acid-binding protein